jgi:hypothetical protein
VTQRKRNWKPADFAESGLNSEALHHGAGIALLRDLDRWQP